MYDDYFPQFLKEYYNLSIPDYISGIGFTTKSYRGQLKVYINVNVPKNQIYMYQIFALYLTLLELAEPEILPASMSKRKRPKSKISKYVRNILENKIKELLESKDPLFIKASDMLKEYHVFRSKKLSEALNKRDNKFVDKN
jgi:hypothetical protein